MKLLVTGASGFLGRSVVGQALERGFDVRAQIRPASDLSKAEWRDDPRVELVRADLRRKTGLVELASGVDAVVHLAAAKTGDLYAQLAGTVVATENLLEAMVAAGVKRLVHVSTFSVYDYRRIQTRTTLDESSPLEARPEERDDYAQTKLLQERLVLDACAKHGIEWTILRPGVIFGAGNEWTARLGFQLGERTWVLTGLSAALPLTYVENCASAIVAVVDAEGAGGQVFNVVDDEHPTQRAYAAELRKRSAPDARIVPVPFPVMRLLAGLATLTNKVLFRGRGKVPGIFVPAKLYARAKPLRFSNAKLRALGWEPPTGWREALAAVRHQVPVSN